VKTGTRPEFPCQRFRACVDHGHGSRRPGPGGAVSALVRP
jgi:hypothetical protein